MKNDRQLKQEEEILPWVERRDRAKETGRQIDGNNSILDEQTCDQLMTDSLPVHYSCQQKEEGEEEEKAEVKDEEEKDEEVNEVKKMKNRDVKRRGNKSW